LGIVGVSNFSSRLDVPNLVFIHDGYEISGGFDTSSSVLNADRKGLEFGDSAGLQ
jgi:hypothetical protein